MKNNAVAAPSIPSRIRRILDEVESEAVKKTSCFRYGSVMRQTR
jgi:hypothetical protein